MRNFFTFIIVIFLMLQVCSIESQSPSWAITGVNVVDIEEGALLENQTVVIADGKIASVSSNAEARADSVIDGSGKYLIPGLWDMHVHFRGGDSLISENKHLLKLFIANGVT
ncbi:MAG: amidohydrolase, partial [Bacteroidetes bacterium]|nr:amidohydrolase [Bacteroidota bacterium]